MSNTKIQNKTSKLFLLLKPQDLVGYYHKQAVERLECRMPNKRTSEHTDFKSYQLSMNASVGRQNLSLVLSQPYHDPGVRHKNTLGAFVQCVVHKAALWKGSLHADGSDALQPDGGKAIILPACTIIKGHYQSQIMNSNAQLSAILATAGNFYYKELDCMIFNFTLSFTRATHPAPFQDSPSHIAFSHKIHIRAGVSFCCIEDSPRNLSLYNGSSSYCHQTEEHYTTRPEARDC